MDWLTDHAQAISAVSSLAMLCVWLVYLQLFLRVFRRDRRPRLLVQQSAGTSTDSECRLVNMSEGPIDVACVILVSETDQETRTHDLAQLATHAAGRRPQPERSRPSARRGPLAQGEYVSLGTFEELLANAAAGSDSVGDSGAGCLELRVIFFYRTYDRPLGVRRRFRFQDGDSPQRIVAEEPRTHQLVTWPSRRQARRWYLDAFGGER